MRGAWQRLAAIVHAATAVVVAAETDESCSATPARREKIIIIGAGMSGVASARALKDEADVLILEAQSRIGGRLRSDRRFGPPVELGAVWIHQAKNNILSEFATRFGCGLKEHHHELHDPVYTEDGQRIPTATMMEAHQRLRQALLHAIHQGRSRAHPSSSMLELLPSHAFDFGPGHDGELQRCAFDFTLFRDIVSDYYAELAQISSKYFGNDLFGGTGKDHILPGGYDCILHGLARGLNVQLDTVVTAVRWGTDGATVTTASGDELAADRVIVTVPLGVLKASIASPAPSVAAPTVAGRTGAIDFEPALPPRMREAISRLGMSDVVRLALKFNSTFWPSDSHFINLVRGGCTHHHRQSSRHAYLVNVANYSGQSILLMDSAASGAQRLAAMSDAEAIDDVVASLRRAFPEAPAPEQATLVRWSEEPFARGGVSYIATSSTPRDQWSIETPLANGRLIFAGEHTSVLHMGTVHGALVAGWQAAAHVRAAVANGTTEPRVYESFLRLSRGQRRYTDGYLEELIEAVTEAGDATEFWRETGAI